MVNGWAECTYGERDTIGNILPLYFGHRVWDGHLSIVGDIGICVIGGTHALIFVIIFVVLYSFITAVHCCLLIFSLDESFVIYGWAMRMVQSGGEIETEP